MDLTHVLLFVGVFCFSCSAHKTVFRENAIIENGKTNSWEFGLSLFPSGLITPDLKLPHLSGHCKEDFNRYRNAILNPDRNTLWAYKMLDATGKFPDGILQGNMNALGSYKSCIEIEAQNQYKNRTFSGKFGGAQFISSYDPMDMIPPTLPLYGVCLPSTCSDEEFRGILYAIDLAINHEPRFIWIPKLSVANEKYELTGSDIFMIVFLAFLGGLLVFATFFDACMIYYKIEIENGNTGFKQFILGFSIYSNLCKLFRITRPSKTPGSSEHLSCLDGMRFISMTLVLTAHTYTEVGAHIPSMNLTPMYISDLNKFLFQCISNGFISVDTFFFMSGTLLAYLTFKELDKRKGNLNVPLFYIHRYLRLTGVYAFILCLHYTLYGAFQTAPQIKTTYPGANAQTIKEICQNVWWKNLLYIGIYDFGLDPAEYPKLGCLGQAWYLDNEMQMFLVILIVIIPLWKWGRFPPYAGLIEAGACCVLSIAVPFGLHIYYKWPGTMILPGPENGDPNYFDKNYIVPWCRFSPYVGGVVMGYILYRTKDKQIRIPRELNLLLWGAAFAIGLAVVYGMNIPKHIYGNADVVTLDQINEDYVELSLAEHSVYGGFHRFAWSVAIGWVIFACCRGYGGWINEFLSWEAFQPLSRLTYIIYLVHLSVNSILYSYTTFLMTSSNFLAVIYCCATLVYSIAVSIVIYIGFELPWLSTEKLVVSMLIGGGPKPKKVEEPK